MPPSMSAEQTESAEQLHVIRCSVRSKGQQPFRTTRQRWFGGGSAHGQQSKRRPSIAGHSPLSTDRLHSSRSTKCRSFVFRRCGRSRHSKRKRSGRCFESDRERRPLFAHLPANQSVGCLCRTIVRVRSFARTGLDIESDSGPFLCIALGRQRQRLRTLVLGESDVGHETVRLSIGLVRHNVRHLHAQFIHSPAEATVGSSVGRRRVC